MIYDPFGFKPAGSAGAGVPNVYVVSYNGGNIFPSTNNASRKLVF